ncbi:uncharacterized protein LOC132286737 [Cornus florida]|uniref:uncharacterized protein LOC132286737 n=1 Tax=Cornus florida TaxID=4283 RepID=UPI00289A2D9B|nr:uncharacterized protein LOC132286737 [Cornus florida]
MIWILLLSPLLSARILYTTPGSIHGHSNIGAGSNEYKHGGSAVPSGTQELNQTPTTSTNNNGYVSSQTSTSNDNDYSSSTSTSGDCTEYTRCNRYTGDCSVYTSCTSSSDETGDYP